MAINITATDRNFNRSSQGLGDIRPVERNTILISLETSESLLQILFLSRQKKICKIVMQIYYRIVPSLLSTNSR